MKNEKKTEKKTEIERLKVLRMNNKESNAITRECIETALFHLMKKKPFQEITITDITKKAGVSRTAYYRNYKSKDDILTESIKSINRTLSDAMKKFDPVSETEKTWNALLSAAVPFKKQLELILSAGFESKLTQEFSKSMNEKVASENLPLIYSNIYWAGAITFVLSQWIRRKMDISTEELSKIGANLMTNGIRTVAEYGNKCE